MVKEWSSAPLRFAFVLRSDAHLLAIHVLQWAVRRALAQRGLSSLTAFAAADSDGVGFLNADNIWTLVEWLGLNAPPSLVLTLMDYLGSVNVDYALFHSAFPVSSSEAASAAPDRPPFVGRFLKTQRLPRPEPKLWVCPVCSVENLVGYRCVTVRRSSSPFG